jgi:hypothetical protein
MGSQQALANAGREIRSAIAVLERTGRLDDDADGLRRLADRECARLLAACARSDGQGDVRAHLGRLELMLSMSLDRASERCRAMADGLALLEEHACGSELGLSSNATDALARRLRDAAAEWRSSRRT